MKNSRRFTIFIIVFVDLLGFSFILPLIPYYAEKYDAQNGDNIVSISREQQQDQIVQFNVEFLGGIR